MVANPKLDVETNQPRPSERGSLERNDEIPGLDFDVPGWDEDKELPPREDGEDWSDWL